MTAQSVTEARRKSGALALEPGAPPGAWRVVAESPALPGHLLSCAPMDGEAQALLTELDRAVKHTDFHAARRVLERLFAACGMLDQIAAEEALRMCLLAMETATLGGDPHASLRAQRLVMAQLEGLPPESESRVRAQLRMLELQAERARFYGDVWSQFAAVKQAAHFLLLHRFRLPASCRYAVVWEIVELLSNCGLRGAAYRLGQRMAELAATELAADAPVESSILADEALFDLPGIMTQGLGLSLPRIGASEAILPQPKAVQLKLEELHRLARQAEEIGLGHWAGGWTYRAQRSQDIISWALGGGSARRLIATMHRGLEHTRVAGLFARQSERERFLEFSKLAADGAGRKAPSEPCRPPMFGGMEGDYLAAAQHTLAGRSAEALAAYARYAHAAHRRAMIGQQVLAADLLAIGEVLVALPKRLALTPKGKDPIRLVCRSVRLHTEQGPSASLEDIAAEQGLSLRRVQQAFKTVGLASPSRFFARLKSGETGGNEQ